MAQQFGYATAQAQSQTPAGTVAGANPVQPAFLEGSACLVTASFFDTTGSPLVPLALSYRIDDVASGAQILGWTAVTVGSAISILVTSAQNALISNSSFGCLNHETHQVLFSVTDPSNNGPFYARCLFDLLRIPGV